MKSTTQQPSSGTKRSLSAVGESRPRKREKYARVACALCKIRKVRCSGNQPCNRCEELQGECVYNDPPHPDTHNTPPQSAHPGLDLSILRVNRICEQMQQKMARFVDSHPGRPCLQRKVPTDNEIPHPKNQTPTDFRYTLSLTHFTLTGRRAVSNSSDFSPKRPCHSGNGLVSPDFLISLLQAAHPVLELGHAKVTQLVTIFKNEVYPIFPCVSIQLGHNLVDMLFSLLNRTQYEATWNLEVIDVELAKAVVAIAMLVKHDTQSPLAADLEDHLLWSVDSCYDQDQPQFEDIIMATLLSLYFDLKHRPVKAWRLSGVAAKLCLELGLHRESFFSDTQLCPDRIADCKRLFACVYDLNRRCSFYSGLPWTLHDREIDLSNLRVEPPESYLAAMIAIDRSLSETWAIVNSPTPQSEKSRERVEFLNFQLQKLVSSLPIADFTPPKPSVNPPPWLDLQLKQFCHLRVHYIRLLNYICSFKSLTDLLSDPHSARKLLTSAAESIDIQQGMMLSAAAREGEADSSPSPLILPSAIKILVCSVSFMLLAVSHYPADYAPLCSDSFYTAREILTNAQITVKDSDLDIRGTLEELQRIADSIQLPSPPPKRPTPSLLLPLALGGGGEQGSAGSDVFEGLQTPDPSFFPILDEVNLAGPDMLYMNNMLG
ncbi:hypothetical protein ASPCAL14647 [Aspergillus calidoustus]|uniref:Zn(2)-C6 fungal-type domain-containing protein n=1 Tax=Aspergillus calidoustus TaxID=454130 RepID=A0A0U5CK99_ASPCI|nr:hypothetical protein ASPCAL14647 [Aspergillus calidoustus]